MASKYDSGLEPAPQDFPEVAAEQQHAPQPYQQPYPQAYQHAYQQPYFQPPYDPGTAPKPEPSPSAAFAATPTAYGSQTAASPFSSPAQPATAPSRAQPLLGRTICGCSLLVFILSCIITLLSAAVVGLAAGMGVESQRASDADARLAALSNASSANPHPTAAAAIDSGCSESPSSVDKTNYTSFSLLGGFKFTRYCNKDAPHPPLLSLFTADFDTCIDACAGYTHYIPRDFGSANGSSSSSPNATCQAVSFIPLWTNKTVAGLGSAPGNCYLKAGPQNETGLTTPNIGTACHAAILT